MLERIRRGQRWLTAIFISVIGLVFVFFIGLGGPLTGSGPSGNAIVQLDDLRYEYADFQRVRAQNEDRIREAIGDQFDAEQAEDFLDTQTLRSIVDGAVMASAARELGFGVSKIEIQSLLRGNPQFLDENGRFDREAFADWASWNYGSQRAFLNAIKPDLLRRKMVRLVLRHTEVSVAEARLAALHQLEQVRIAFVAIDTEAAPADTALGDAEVEERVADREAELRALYEERKETYDVAEKVRARHILLRVEEDAEPDAVALVLTRAEETLARIRDGADFAEVAKEVSEDPGTKESGGDLGFIARGETNPALEEAAFALDEGELSELVRSDAGFHIVRVEERELEGSRTFEDVHDELARELALAQVARERAESLAEELSTAVRSGQSLEDAARARDLTLERTALLKRRPDGFVPGLGASREVLDTAFALDLERPSSSRVFRVGSKLALIQLLERVEPDPETLADAVERERDRLEQRRQNERLQEWVDTHRNELVDSGRLLVDATLVTGG